MYVVLGQVYSKYENKNKVILPSEPVIDEGPTFHHDLSRFMQCSEAPIRTCSMEAVLAGFTQYNE